MTKDDVIPSRTDVLSMALEAGFEIDCCSLEWHDRIERFAVLVAAAKRENKPHSLGPGEMELSLRREHNGELFECRYRFTAEQVMHGQDWMVTEVAKQLDTEIDHSIRARGQA